MTLWNEMKTLTNKTYTENGDIAVKSTLNKNLDLFGIAGASHNGMEIQNLFLEAFNENPRLAIQNLFYIRDIYRGIGFRDIFRTLMNIVIDKYGEDSFKVFDDIVELGRWDDTFVYLNHPSTKALAINRIKGQLIADDTSEHPSLLAKWMPTKAGKKTTKASIQMIKDLGIHPKEYRRLMKKLRNKLNIVETHLTNKEYNKIEYSHVPSKAMNKYKNAFLRNDPYFKYYIDSLSNGETKVNVKTLSPHDIFYDYHEVVRSYYNPHVEILISKEEQDLKEAQWKTMLESIKSQNTSNTIVVPDSSGSMVTNINNGTGTAIQVAFALAIMFSQLLEGSFKDKFITFSNRPELVELSPYSTLAEKAKHIYGISQIEDTNIEAVYDLILQASLNIEKKEEYIDRIVIISDMQFNQGTRNSDISTFEYAKKQFAANGIPFPEIVFWNVNTRHIAFPVSDNENVKLVSGFSKGILESVMNDTTLSAEEYMLDTLSRYEGIAKKIVK